MAGERSIAREYLEALIIAAIFLRFANTFVVQTFYIPTGSMEDTLLVGDHLFVNRFIYGPAPTAPERKLLPARPVRRGDIVVFRSKETPRMDVVKRCIGLPGDVIRVVDKKLYINGKAVNDSAYAVHKDPKNMFVPYPYAPRDNFGPFTVPPDSYFCMGDNRDNSYDSRYWGELPASYLKGRAFLIYWSNGVQSSSESQGIRSSVRDFVKTALGFFTSTRWNRTFHLVR